jgi:hypothetical protein
LGKEYERVDEVGRCRLLDEAEKRTGLNRKHLIHFESPGRAKAAEAPQSARRIRSHRGDSVDRGLRHFRASLRQRLVASLASAEQRGERLQKLGELRCNEAVASQLKQIFQQARSPFW